MIALADLVRSPLASNLLTCRPLDADTSGRAKAINISNLHWVGVLSRGVLFSPFPLIHTTTFGPQFATANISASTLLIPFVNLLKARTGNWHIVVTAALINVAGVGLALFVLRPLRSKQLSDAIARIHRI